MKIIDAHIHYTHNEYFEIYCDETLESFYFLNDGTQIKTYKEIEKIMNV